MKLNPHATELTPQELALLACYQDGALAPDGLLQAERLLERSAAARQVIAETSALLNREPGKGGESETTQPLDTTAVGPGATLTPAPRTPSPRMGWRTFLPLAAAGVVGMLVFWPGPGSLNLMSWSDSLVRRGGGERFDFPVIRGEAPEEDLAETAGIRWVGLRIALRARRSAEADSLAQQLSTSLTTVSGSGPARGRIEGLIASLAPPPVEELEAVQRTLVDQLGHPFEEAVVLETLRRAAGVGHSDLAAELVVHPHLDDGVGDDLDPEIRTRLLELCEDDLTAEELAEMEAIVTDVLRRRT